MSAEESRNSGGVDRFRRMKAPALLLFLTAMQAAGGAIVRDDAGLRAALSSLRPGSVVKIAPGNYQPGISIRDVRGTAENPVIIEALDPARPPLFEGGGQAWHLTDVSHFILRGISCRGQRHNGVNVDDGGSFDTPSSHVTLEKLRIEDIGPRGNFDAIKCSGVKHLRILDCHISGWGGQAIDFVGCHHAEIARCAIIGKPGFSQHTGPQFKGGSSDVRMHHCRLENAGQRPIHVGGSTGPEFFRPLDAPHEAARIRIEDNHITGGQCAVAFTGAVDCAFTHNTVADPGKWVLRILQESRDKRFRQCGDNVFSNNLIVYERAKVREAANIGADTRAGTFRFSGNHWFARDSPAQSRPALPVAEKDAVHGGDPMLGPDGLPRAKGLKAGARKAGD